MSKNLADSAPASRARAARTLAGLGQVELAKAIGVSVTTLRRMEYCQRAITTDELLAIGEVCGAPDWFMRGGFEACPGAHNDLRALVKQNQRLIKQNREIVSQRYIELFNAIEERLGTMEETMRAMERRSGDNAKARSRAAPSG
jgi:transcriptional regulator with XRE-family HTH domain